MINHEVGLYIYILKSLVIPVMYILIAFFFERKRNPNKKSFRELSVLFVRFYFVFLLLFFFFLCCLLPLAWNDSSHIPPKTIKILAIPIIIAFLITIRILRKYLTFNEINLFVLCYTIISIIIFFLIDKILLINFYLAFSILFCWLVFAISILALLIKMIAKFIHSRKKDKNNGDENIKE